MGVGTLAVVLAVLVLVCLTLVVWRWVTRKEERPELGKKATEAVANMVFVTLIGGLVLFSIQQYVTSPEVRVTAWTENLSCEQQNSDRWPWRCRLDVTVKNTGRRTLNLPGSLNAQICPQELPRPGMRETSPWIRIESHSGEWVRSKQDAVLQFELHDFDPGSTLQTRVELTSVEQLEEVFLVNHHPLLEVGGLPPVWESRCSNGTTEP